MSKPSRQKGAAKSPKAPQRSAGRDADNLPWSGETFELLCCDTGRVALVWSLAEDVLDQLVVQAFYYLGGDKLEKEIPRALNRKLPFLRKAFRNLDALRPLAEDGVKLLVQAVRLAEARDAMLHGTMLTVVNEDTLVLRRYEFPTPQRDQSHEYVFSLDDVHTVGAQIEDLASQLADLLRRMPGPRSGRRASR